MPYSTYGQQASRYREMEVLSATPGELVVILYDHLLVQLAKAGHASGTAQIDDRSAALEKSRAVLGELLVTLSRAEGGAIADQLASLYAFMLGELTTLGVRPNVRRLERITVMVRQLRDAFAQAVSQTEAVPVGAL